MKKFIAVVLALVLALSVSAMAFADTTSTTTTVVTVSTLTCPVCGRIYTNTTSGVAAYNACLDSHRDADGYLVCQTCGKKYENPSEYIKCLNSHIELATYTCETCGAKFSDQEAYNTHVATHFSNTNYHWTEYVGMTLPELFDQFYNYLSSSGVLQLITDMFYDIWNMVKDGIASQQEAADVAGAVDNLDSALDGISLDNDVVANVRAFLNAIKQKIKDLYASEVETAPVEETEAEASEIVVTETEAPVDTGSASAGIAAFAVITAAAAAAYVCSKKKA